MIDFGTNVGIQNLLKPSPKSNKNGSVSLLKSPWPPHQQVSRFIHARGSKPEPSPNSEQTNKLQFARPLGVLDHLKLSFLFSSTFNSLSIYFLVARGPPLGPKFRKIHSRGKWLGRLSAPWPLLGPIFRIFEPPERHQKFMFFLHRSKRPKNR